MSILTKKEREEILHRYQAESIADAAVIRALLDTIGALEAERDAMLEERNKIRTLLESLGAPGVPLDVQIEMLISNIKYLGNRFADETFGLLSPPPATEIKLFCPECRSRRPIAVRKPVGGEK